MTSMDAPFYDVNLSYEDNYAKGPFGAFATALAREDAADAEAADAAGAAAGTAVAAGAAAFLGIPVDLPFGIPAGPLLNSRYTHAAFLEGFDIAVYKTVRSRPWACNAFPNVLSVHPQGDSIDPEGTEKDEGVLADSDFGTDAARISISNSFGVPSQDPDVWQPDMALAVQQAGAGQVLVGSFQGSRTPGMSDEAYIADCVTTARLVQETGAKIIEMNTSCPNEGHNRLLCHNPELVGRICDAVKNEIGDTPFMIKLAYLPADEQVETMVRDTAAHGTVQALCTINTISCKLVDAQGGQALPGAGRDRSGVCGAAIRPAGLAMVQRVAAVRELLGVPFDIVGVGGVTTPADYEAYRAAGAAAVMSATGAMWNPALARQIKAGEVA
ncbi:tRNA-dihydrouridine synthase [Pseudoscardovia suis]|uniref:tRNA-dihydrouridine synthase n=1 Tax=Pseudoscardovia suis TaxID=987063 RepID=UPI003F996E23